MLLLMREDCTTLENPHHRSGGGGVGAITCTCANIGTHFGFMEKLKLLLSLREGWSCLLALYMLVVSFES